MIDVLAQAHEAGSSLESWRPLVALLGVFGAIVVGLFAYGRTPPHPSRLAALVLRIPEGLERLTGIPGWAATAAGTSLYGLLVAGQGFYSDVAWHIALGRDEELFTAPHTAIVLGLGMITLGAGLGILVASLRGVRADRKGALRTPRSLDVLGLLGVAALCGFPLDELWHHAYGIDVTMWSPTHMLMILGASLSPIACWLVLAEAGVRLRDPDDPAPRRRWKRFAHVLAAFLVLQGLAASQGEFAFGVPQFQQLFHPVLVMIAGGFAFAAIRVVHGRWWSVGAAAVTLAIESAAIFGDPGPLDPRSGGFYVASALGVEIVAFLWGTERRLRFGLLSGLAIGTIGFAGEWWWNQGAGQPWKTALLPDALLLGLLAALGSALLGTAFGAVITSRARPERPVPARGRIPAGVLALAGLGVLFTLAWPMPRTADPGVTARLQIEDAGDEEVVVRASIDPDDAAEGARWFEVIAWQGGGLELVDMERTGPGAYVSAEPVPAGGDWKTMIRIHRGTDMMSVPVYLPADPEIGEAKVPAADRRATFVRDQDYLMRETHAGSPWFGRGIYALFGLAGLAWVWGFTWGSRHVRRRETDEAREPREPVGVPTG